MRSGAPSPIVKGMNHLFILSWEMSYLLYIYYSRIAFSLSDTNTNVSESRKTLTANSYKKIPFSSHTDSRERSTTHPLWPIPIVISKCLWKSIFCNVTDVLGSNHLFSSVCSHSFIHFSKASSFSSDVRQWTCIVRFSAVFYIIAYLIIMRCCVVDEKHTPLRRQLILTSYI